jgi:general secretion pathway protein F
MDTTAQNYIFKAVDAAGVLHAGEVSSPSRAVALQILSQRGLIPVSVDERAAQERASWLVTLVELLRARYRMRRQATSRELLGLTQALASLLKAGLTIDRALQISASLAPRPASRALGERLLQTVRSGKSLSSSLAASGQRLPPYYISMVDAGEIGGSLPEALARLGELMNKQMEVRERVRSALVYPSLLGAVVLVMLVMLLVFVLPRFELLFSESQAPLPWSTQVVLRLGRLTADYWWVFLIGGITTVATFVIWRNSGRGRLQFDRWLLRTRLTLGLPATLDTARFLRTVANLAKNGLPLSSALRVSRGTVTNRAMLDALNGVAREVQAGEAFSACFARAGCFPAVAVQMARVGEETGHLEELLQSAATVLEEEAHRILERLLSLVIPLVTIGMGLLVAGLIASVLIGLLSINDLAF